MFHVEHNEPDVEWMKQMFHVEHFNATMRPWLPGSDQMPCFMTHTTPKPTILFVIILLKAHSMGGI